MRTKMNLSVQTDIFLRYSLGIHEDKVSTDEAPVVLHSYFVSQELSDSRLSRLLSSSDPTLTPSLHDFLSRHRPFLDFGELRETHCQSLCRWVSRKYCELHVLRMRQLEVQFSITRPLLAVSRFDKSDGLFTPTFGSGCLTHDRAHNSIDGKIDGVGKVNTAKQESRKKLFPKLAEPL